MRRALLAVALIGAITPTVHAQGCPAGPLQLQVLNAGTAELAGGRSSASLLLWIKDKPRLLIDAGPGSAPHFAHVGANVADLDAILFTQLRIERTADLPALLQLATATPRKQALPLYGPPGNRYMPSMVSFTRSLFDPTRGSWRHLGDLLSPLTQGSFKLDPHDLRAHPTAIPMPREPREEILSAFTNDRLRVSAIALPAAQTPALAWRIDSLNKRIVVSDRLAGGELFEQFARGADVLVLPHTAMEGEGALEVTPDMLARFLRATAVKQVVLTPRTRVTLGHEEETTAAIARQGFAGTLTLANDLDCVAP